MKALVLAGGAGTRLRPITHTSAKQLVPVANKPILFYGLESIAAAGVTEVGIIVGDTESEVRAAIGDGSRLGLEVTYIRQEAPLGLAHAVLIAADFLGDDDFLVFLGDNFVFGGITEIVRRFTEQRPDAQVLVTKVGNPSEFGVAELDREGKLIGLEEKPTEPRTDLALVGVYLFTPVAHTAMRAIEPSARGELEITDALRWLLDGGYDVRAGEISGYWKDTGNVADMLEVNRLLLETLEPAVLGEVDPDTEIVGRVRIEPGARVSASRVVGPAIIGAGTVVTGSYVGPSTSIAENCLLRDSEVEFSIVLADSVLDGVHRVEASLIGRNVTVHVTRRVPVAHRLVIGDHGWVQLPN
ncbi:glucose-1-phosphate thymidylyltransferase [Amycolatopsis cihanbeyliensis]|uniref:Glucose-1-phosphate thymidylyltransferase n=1 Tax=Amycolatopsis cihanbeyliensis TaxID=1128664 RepID=A0A542DBE7_AMYCI|nr:glucose-1-phosphate thymidylyltransferase [Amycolatopsis cihanbeyliensis]TQJ00398.1 glucose-1-phosphate thymidylyltransferase [Amycolatopsis cihanbeyliensis]